MILEDGTGLTDSDSYVDPAEDYADSYIAGHLYASAYTDATDPQKEAACIMATRTLDACFEWNGIPVSTSQALGWPRVISETRQLAIPSDEVPRKVKAATLELAIALLQRNRTSDTEISAPVERIGLGSGALEMAFGKPDPGGPVDMIPPLVVRILADYGTPQGSGSGGSMVRVSR